MRKLLDEFRMIYKGCKEIHRIRPWIILIKIIRSLFHAITPFINIYMSALIIDGLIAKQRYSSLINYAIITVSINLIVVIVYQLLTKIDNVMLREFDHRIMMVFSKKTISLDYETIEDPETHRKRQLIEEQRNIGGNGLWKLVYEFSNLMDNFFKTICSISLTYSLFLMYSTNTNLEGIIYIASLPIASIIMGLGIIANVIVCIYSDMTKTKNFFEIINDIVPFNRIMGYYIHNYIMQYTAGKEIRIYNQRKVIMNDINKMLDNFDCVVNKASYNQTKYTSITTISTVIISILVYLFVGLKALAGLFGVGAIVKYVGSINEFVTSFSYLVQQIAAFVANNHAVRAYFDFVELPNKLYQGTLPVEKRFKCDYGDNDYKIEFDNVSFKYPGTQEYALKNVSLKLRVGQRMAVVGMNGSGKTTFIKLLCRLYDPTEGVIKLNGIDIKKYDYDDYLSIFSVVFQDFKLFSFELGQNVGNTIDYDEDKVKRYLTKAGFGERYSKLDKGLKTCLYKDFEEDGVEISGGEAQKIALARALYKDAPFIVLDEPTAALDPIAEFEIYSRFNEIVEDKTAIYISHRLSSCRFCDDIVVFHEGRLIQRGDHDHLLTESEGKYNELWNAQAQYYNEKQSV